MPFGPFKGKPIEELSTRYLQWIANDVSPSEYPELVEAAKDELKLRKDFAEATEIRVTTRRPRP